MLPILYGIASAATWGAADFIGGLASKRTSPYRVLFLAELAGVVPFILLAILTVEAIPPLTDMLWAGLGLEIAERRAIDVPVPERRAHLGAPARA